MSVTFLDTPESNAVVFRVGSLSMAEGVFDMTFWRPIHSDDNTTFQTGSKPFVVDGSIIYDNIEVQLRNRIITTIPIVEEEAENYIGEITTHDFSIGLYNTRSDGDIVSAKWGNVILPTLAFNAGTGGRLLFKYLMPEPEANAIAAVIMEGPQDSAHNFVNGNGNIVVDLGSAFNVTWLPGQYSIIFYPNDPKKKTTRLITEVITTQSLKFDGATFPASGLSVNGIPWQIVKLSQPGPTELYCRTDFTSNDGASSIWCVGQAQAAVAGVDYRWITANIKQNGNPILDERDNAPIDAEQIFDLKFVHSAASALDKMPSQPNLPVAGGSPLWSLPFCNQPSASPFMSLNYKPLGEVSVLNLATVPGIAGMQYVNSSDGNTSNPLWLRHVDAFFYFSALFDATFGAKKWTFICDPSPIGLEGAMLTPTIDQSNTKATFEQKPSGSIVYPQVDRFNSLWLPQTIFGLLDAHDTANVHANVLKTTWPQYHQSAWSGIQEICMMNGWIPIVKIDNSSGSNVAHVHFQDRTKPLANTFTALAPISATSESHPESENGIQVDGLATFLNANGPDGWYDDILAFKRDSGSNYADLTEKPDTSVSENVIRPQANPYIIPPVASKPAKIQQLMRYGGYQYVIDNGDATTSFTGTLVTPYGTYNDGTQNHGLSWPMLAPLVSSGTPIPATATLNPNFQLPFWKIVDCQPVMRSSFSLANASGVTKSVVSDSLRQTLARFYGVLFVNSNRKYSVQDATINQFFAIDTTDGSATQGERTGVASWQNVQLFGQRLFPDGKHYWCKHITRDPNAEETKTEYFRIDSVNSKLLWDFGDSAEGSGTVKGNVINTGGGGPGPFNG